MKIRFYVNLTVLWEEVKECNDEGVVSVFPKFEKCDDAEEEVE